MAEVVLTEPFLDVFEELTPLEQIQILDKLNFLRTFPEMYPVRESGPRVFRGHRFFLAGNWQVYYKYASGTVYVRGAWPARIPYR